MKNMSIQTWRCLPKEDVQSPQMPEVQVDSWVFSGSNPAPKLPFSARSSSVQKLKRATNLTLRSEIR